MSTTPVYTKKVFSEHVDFEGMFSLARVALHFSDLHQLMRNIMYFASVVRKMRKNEHKFKSQLKTFLFAQAFL